MPQVSIRRLLVVAAALVACLGFFWRAANVSIGTHEPSLNAAFVVAALGCFVVELARLRLDSRPLALRIMRGMAVVGLGLSVLFLGLLALSFGSGVRELGKVPAGGGNLVAYHVSVPLVDDFVVVDFERRLIPGLYHFRRMGYIDPAWDPAIQASAKDQMLVAYGDGANVRRASVISQRGITTRWSGP